MFRKKAGAWPVFLVLALLLSLLVLPAQAAEEAIGVTINGTPVTYDDGYGRPFVDAAGRTQVPFRLTMETFGCTVDWDNDTRTVVITTEPTGQTENPANVATTADPYHAAAATGSRYQPKVGDQILCDDGSTYTITDVSRWDKNMFQDGPLPELPTDRKSVV